MVPPLSTNSMGYKLVPLCTQSEAFKCPFHNMAVEIHQTVTQKAIVSSQAQTLALFWLQTGSLQIFSAHFDNILLLCSSDAENDTESGATQLTSYSH